MVRVDFTIVPVLVGNTSKKVEEEYGSLFAKYMQDPSNFFVISSDFCHWGQRFDYIYYNSNAGPIWSSIEQLDRKGMEIIESRDVNRFYNYLKETGNTICGRHPIGIMMQVIL